MQDTYHPGYHQTAILIDVMNLNQSMLVNWVVSDTWRKSWLISAKNAIFAAMGVQTREKLGLLRPSKHCWGEICFGELIVNSNNIGGEMKWKSDDQIFK